MDYFKRRRLRMGTETLAAREQALGLMDTEIAPPLVPPDLEPCPTLDEYGPAAEEPARVEPLSASSSWPVDVPVEFWGCAYDRHRPWWTLRHARLLCEMCHPSAARLRAEWECEREREA